MLSKEDNELLTRVGRGTPMGELLRRFLDGRRLLGTIGIERPLDLFVRQRQDGGGEQRRVDRA